MENTLQDRSESAIAARSSPPGARDGSGPPPSAEAKAPPTPHAASPTSEPAEATPPSASAAPSNPWRKRLIRAGAVVGLAIGAFALAPTVRTMMDTVSTDDAFVNGHVTYVAPRVAGQVARVLVDDNDRVKKGDLLVQLDREPYQVQVDLKKAAVVNAEADVEAAKAQVWGILAQARSQRWKLQRAMEGVDDKVALLKARFATLRSKEASLVRARADLARSQELFNRGVGTREVLDQRIEAVRTAEAAVKEALEEVHETRVALGLEPHPARGALTDVPADLNQTFSGVRESLNELMQSAALVGLPLYSVDLSPQQVLGEFVKRDKEGNVDRILERVVPHAPAVRQAEAKLLQARRDLAQADLNLRYCDIISEIDGVVTSRNINPGNNVSPGQGLMAVRSIGEIWIDANFKETQLAELRIGQRVRCEIDMYGGHREFEGRITGFTMGTGQTLALLPAQNATGNFVKIVQRLPVRIELTDYDPEKAPLFVGLSVTPYVYYKEPAKGPNAGRMLRPTQAAPASRAGGASQPPDPDRDSRGGA